MENLTEKEIKMVDSFLRRMKQLGAIETVTGVRGGYRFPNLLHALYFWLESEYAKD